jgi:hypothetical protein
MTARRKQRQPEFKTRAARHAVLGELTIGGLMAFRCPSEPINVVKKQAIERLAAAPQISRGRRAGKDSIASRNSLAVCR